MRQFKFISTIGAPQKGSQIFSIVFKWACHYDIVSHNGVQINPVTGQLVEPVIMERVVKVIAQNEKLAYQKLMAEFPTTCMEILVNGVWITRGKIVEMS
jgi:hypothetical protein